jgi:hypothetical protein
MKRLLLPALSLAIASPLPAAPVFQEKGGVLVMEAESTSSSLGAWEKKTDVQDYGGECHLEFTGNKPESGPPKSPLKYSFQINKGGTYELAIRCRKRLETKRDDISNDCYVALKGDFDTGGDVPLKVLKSDTKLYGGSPDKWGWSAQLDVGHKKYAPRYQLKAGETYELTISGRSKNFNIDRIFFVHADQGMGQVKNSNPDESKTDAGGGGTTTAGSKLKSYPARELKNKDGRVIKAQLIDKDGDTLVIVKDGRRFEIAISSLSAEDQAFLKDWWPE